MHANEIRDFMMRAPRRITFNGAGIVNNSHVRYRWLAELAYGSIHERINRRAGQTEMWKPWCNPLYKAMARNQRKLKKHGLLRGAHA